MTRMLLVATAALLTSACHIGSEAKDRDAGPSTSRTYSVGAFDKIESAGAYDLKVVSGDKPGVTATGGASLLDETEVIVENGELKIRPKNHGMFHWSGNGTKTIFTITTPALRALSLAGAGDASIDKVSGDFEATLAGAGDLKMATVDAGNLKLSVAGSGNISGAGKANNLDLSIAGSGDVDVQGLATQTADISIAGAGDVRANVASTAKVSILGSGDVEISGGAKCDVSKMGGGEVKCH